jgi:isocitrate dehydrogenase (NAD+)
MTYQATLFPGDGIGPEITAETLKVLSATGVAIAWDTQLAGVTAVEQSGTPIPEATLESIRHRKLALKGPLTTPVGTGFRSVNVALRKAFELYANLRPAYTILPGRYDNVDVVLVRENLEGLYSGVEHFIQIGSDPRAVAVSEAILTRHGAERIVRFAFDYAVANGRKKVTVVHKANILKMVGGLFLEVAHRVGTEFEGRVALQDMIVDNAAMQLVMRPEQFDVIVSTNLFGDILSDQISGLVGGLGMTPGGNIGSGAAIFEAVHGSAPDIAGRGIANPSATSSRRMMLDHLGARRGEDPHRHPADPGGGRIRTRDVGGRPPRFTWRCRPRRVAACPRPAGGSGPEARAAIATGGGGKGGPPHLPGGIAGRRGAPDSDDSA